MKNNSLESLYRDNDISEVISNLRSDIVETDNYRLKVEVEKAIKLLMYQKGVIDSFVSVMNNAL